MRQTLEYRTDVLTQIGQFQNVWSQLRGKGMGMATTLGAKSSELSVDVFSPSSADRHGGEVPGTAVPGAPSPKPVAHSLASWTLQSEVDGRRVSDEILVSVHPLLHDFARKHRSSAAFEKCWLLTLLRRLFQ